MNKAINITSPWQYDFTCGYKSIGAEAWPGNRVGQWNLLIMLGGACRIVMAGHAVETEPHTILLIAPGKPRAFVATESWSCYWFHFSMPRPPEWQVVAPGFFLFRPSRPDYRRSLLALMDAHRVSMELKPGWHELVNNLVEGVVIRGNNASKCVSEDNRMHLARELLDARGKNYGMDVIARKCGMSRALFYRKFREAYGLSPRLYREQKMLRLAQVMIEDGGSSFSGICERAGFSDLCYFSRRFRKMFGMSPQQYRTKIRLP